MSDERLALCLVDADNDFQQLLKVEAELSARKQRLRLEVHHTGHDLVAQIRRLRALLAQAEPPRAVLLLAALDHGLAPVAHELVRAGVSIAFLNRTEDDLEALRREARAGATACCVCADELETGRVQGRQFRRLLDGPGLVLYVQGSTRSLAARDRTAGMREAARGAPFELDLLEAGWTRGEAREALRKWLRIVVPGGLRLDLIGCQNDQIALGSLDALADVAAETGRPELGHVPVTGCDGTPQLGQALVREHRLLATVALPRSSGTAVELLARLLRHAALPPPLTTLRAVSVPAESALQPIARERSR